MAEKSRIKFNPVTKEIEIEGSESFVTVTLDKIQAMLSGAPVKKSCRQEGTSIEKNTESAQDGNDKRSSVKVCLDPYPE